MMYNKDEVDWDELRSRIKYNDELEAKEQTEDQEEIDWEDLRQKVQEADLHEALILDEGAEDDEEDSDDEEYCNCSNCDADCTSKALNISNEINYHDEHGFLDPRVNSSSKAFSINVDEDTSPEEISHIAWNKGTPIVPHGNYLGLGEMENEPDEVEEPENNSVPDTSDILCKHFDKETMGEGEIYIYPINDYQRVCLCKFCNANLASKMLEQLALETFMTRL